MELADPVGVLLIAIPRRLLHPDLFLYVAVKECRFDVHLFKFPIEGGGDSEDRFITHRLYHQGESLIEI